MDVDKRLVIERVKIDDTLDAEREMELIGADSRGIAIMRDKAVFRVVKVHDVPLRAANLLKQIFLSKGGEAAVSRGTAAMTVEQTDVLLMGTIAIYRASIESMREQPFGLKALADELVNFL